MGAQGLWDLLAPVSHRIFVETLVSKKFPICTPLFSSLLFKNPSHLSISALKHRTIIARLRLRKNTRAKSHKIDEKLLLNQLKLMRLKELAKDLEKQNAVNKKGKQAKILEENKRVLEKLDEFGGLG